MGVVLSRLGRPFRTYNIENRAQKVISQDKPVPAPRHNPDQLTYEQLLKEKPEAFEESQRKHQQLDNYLKDVYVKSHGPEHKTQHNPERPLPQDRTSTMDFEYGFKEPEKVPVGKVTLKQALTFITDHQNRPDVHTVEKISQDYAVPNGTISNDKRFFNCTMLVLENILNYFKVFEVYIPEKRNVKARFAGPSVPRIKVVERKRPELPSGKPDET